jgi:hypothetical protein
MEGQVLFGLDAEHRLYWDGKPVQLRQRLSLSRWQAAFAIIASLSAAVVAVVEVLSFLGFGLQ